MTSNISDMECEIACKNHLNLTINKQKCAIRTKTIYLIIEFFFDSTRKTIVTLRLILRRIIIFNNLKIQQNLLQPCSVIDKLCI